MKKYLGAIIIAIALVLPSCSTKLEPVMIAADPSDPEQMVLAEIYRQILELEGRQVGLIGQKMTDPADKFELLQSHEANLAVFCVGDFVEAENHPEYVKLTSMLKGVEDNNNVTDANNADLELATYDAAVATLPGRLVTVDPSPAQGCGVATAPEGSAPRLPQNIIPVFEAGLFDRGMRQAINKTTRAMNTEDLAKLVEQTKRDGNPRGAVNEWLMAKAGMGVELDRIVEEGGEARDL